MKAVLPKANIEHSRLHPSNQNKIRKNNLMKDKVACHVIMDFSLVIYFLTKNAFFCTSCSFPVPTKNEKKASFNFCLIYQN